MGVVEEIIEDAAEQTRIAFDDQQSGRDIDDEWPIGIEQAKAVGDVVDEGLDRNAFCLQRRNPPRPIGHKLEPGRGDNVGDQLFEFSQVIGDRIEATIERVEPSLGDDV